MSGAVKTEIKSCYCLRQKTLVQSNDGLFFEGCATGFFSFFLLCGKEQLESDKIHLFPHISQCDFMRIRII